MQRQNTEATLALALEAEEAARQEAIQRSRIEAQEAKQRLRAARMSASTKSGSIRSLSPRKALNHQDSIATLETQDTSGSDEDARTILPRSRSGLSCDSFASIGSEGSIRSRKSVVSFNLPDMNTCNDDNASRYSRARQSKPQSGTTNLSTDSTKRLSVMNLALAFEAKNKQIVEENKAMEPKQRLKNTIKEVMERNRRAGAMLALLTVAETSDSDSDSDDDECPMPSKVARPRFGTRPSAGPSRPGLGRSGNSGKGALLRAALESSDTDDDSTSKSSVKPTLAIKKRMSTGSRGVSAPKMPPKPEGTAKRRMTTGTSSQGQKATSRPSVTKPSGRVSTSPAKSLDAKPSTMAASGGTTPRARSAPALQRMNTVKAVELAREAEEAARQEALERSRREAMEARAAAKKAREAQETRAITASSSLRRPAGPGLQRMATAKVVEMAREAEEAARQEALERSRKEAAEMRAAARRARLAQSVY